MKPEIQKVQVENPYFSTAHPVCASNPKRVPASVNVRTDAVMTLFSRGLLDIAQKAAADRFAAVWQAAGGRVQSLDYSQDRVDAGKSDPMLARLAAVQELTRCQALIGRRGFQVIEAICGEGKALSEIAQTKRERLTLADNLRADLDELALIWGLRTNR